MGTGNDVKAAASASEVIRLVTTTGNVVVSAITETSAVLTWNPATGSYAFKPDVVDKTKEFEFLAIKDFRYTVTVNGVVKVSDAKNITTSTLTGLTVDTTYPVVVTVTIPETKDFPIASGAYPAARFTTPVEQIVT